MAAQPNIGGMHRFVYVVAGLGLILGGFFGVETPWLRYAMPVGGAILVVQGIVGWCGTVAMLRAFSGSKQEAR